MEKECKSDKKEIKETECREFFERVFFSQGEERDSLIEQMENVDVVDELGFSLMVYAISIDYNELAEVLIRHGANVNAKAWNGCTILQYTFKQNAKKCAMLLVENGVDVNAVDENGKTVLMYAVRMVQKDIVELLIKNGANINAVDNEGMTALMYALKDGIQKRATQFEDKEPSDNRFVNKMLYELNVAAPKRGREIVRMLIENGADL